MVCFSKIQKILDWCFVPSEFSAKHSNYSHPLFSFIFGLLTAIYPVIKLTSKLEDLFPYLKGTFPNWATTKLPIMLSFYVLTILTTRLKIIGSIAFYDFLWACNIAILLLIAGLIKSSPLLIGSSMILIAVDQMLWYLDVFGYLIFGKFYVGVAAFLKWPDTPIIKKLTTTHHIWFIPLCLYLLKNHKHLNLQTYLCSMLYSLILIILGRVLAPKIITYKRDGKEEKIYTNLNLAWEVWKDVKIKQLQGYDKKPFPVYGFFNLLIWNGGNLGFFIILKGLLKLLNKYNYF